MKPAFLVLTVLIGLGCGGETAAPERPQARTISEPSPGGGVVQEDDELRMAMVERPLPTALELDVLARAAPEIMRLPKEQQIAVYIGMDRVSAPCEACEDTTLARCIVEEKAPECAVLGELADRAGTLAAAGQSKLVMDAVAYPDLWFAEARFDAGADVGVMAWVDPASPFLEMVLTQLQTIQAQEGVSVRLVVWPAGEEGVELARWCRGAEAAGVGAFDCLTAVQTERSEAKTLPTVAQVGARLGVAADVVKLGDAAQLSQEAELQAQAQRLGVRASPTWFVAGHRLRGAQSLGAIGRLVQLEGAAPINTP